MFRSPDQYAQPVLALIALRQMEARFDIVHAELSKTFTGRLKPTPQDYHGHGAVFLPDHARFSYLLGLPETENLAEALNAAMEAITEHNPDLAGVLPRGYLVGNAQGAAYPAVTAATFERAAILLPPADLVKRFTDFAEPMLRLADRLRKTNGSLAACRDLLLPRLISGQLSVAEAERDLEEAA